MFRPSRALVVALLLFHCSSDEAQVERYCESTCNKLSECDVLFGSTATQCKDNCVMGSNTNNGMSTCEPSKSEVDACINAISAAQCSDLTSGNTPMECDICPDNNNPPPPPPPGMGPPPPPPPPMNGNCASLTTCCTEFMDQMQQDACNAIVMAGSDMLCAQTLTGYQANGFCM